VTTPASFPPLEPVELGDPADGFRGEFEQSDPGAATVAAARGASVAAEQDVAMAEAMIAADTVAVADTAPAVPTARRAAAASRRICCGCTSTCSTSARGRT
jgi:hypothetical protein